MRLVSKHCCKTIWIAMFTLYLSRSNLSFSKSGCGRLPEYWLLIGWNCAGFAPYMGITSLAVKQVRLGSVKRATCTDFVAKSRTTFDFRQQFCATCDNLICCKTGLNVGGKTRKIVFSTRFAVKNKLHLFVAVLSYVKIFSILFNTRLSFINRTPKN